MQPTLWIANDGENSQLITIAKKPVDRLSISQATGNKTSVRVESNILIGGFSCRGARIPRTYEAPFSSEPFESHEKSAEKARKKLKCTLLTRGHYRHSVFVSVEACLSRSPSTDTRLYLRVSIAIGPNGLFYKPVHGLFKGCWLCLWFGALRAPSIGPFRISGSREKQVNFASACSLALTITQNIQKNGNCLLETANRRNKLASFDNSSMRDMRIQICIFLRVYAIYSFIIRNMKIYRTILPLTLSYSLDYFSHDRDSDYLRKKSFEEKTKESN